MAFLLDITTARLFVSVAEEASIARAARREGIAASAISKRISELEQRLNIVLLRRHAGGVELTEAGAALLRRARRLLHEASELEADLRQLGKGVSGLVRIAATETTLVDFLPPLLARFLGDNPGIRVDLDERLHGDIPRVVREEAADIGILPAAQPPDGAWSRPCYRDQLVAVMRPDHPLAQYPGVTVAELLDYPVVGPSRRSAVGAELSRQAEALGRSVQARAVADGYDAVCRLAEEGLGIGLVTESSFRLFAKSLNLVSLPLLDAWARRQHRVCVRSPEALAPAARLLLERLLDGNG